MANPDRYIFGRSTITASKDLAKEMVPIYRFMQKNLVTITDKYIDEGLSGTNTNRPGFQKLLYDAEHAKFNKVIIYDISRGSRNVADWFLFREEMNRLNIKVISCCQQLGDIDDPNAFLMETISVALGQHQVLDTRKKSLAGSRARALKGAFMGGVPPWVIILLMANMSLMKLNLNA